MDTSERLKNTIGYFVLKYNYWGYLFSKISMVRDPALPSIMGVAPTSEGTICLRYHPDLVDATDDANLKLVIEHEGMHILNKHISRLIRVLSNEINMSRRFFKSRVWNIAADCSVNKQANIPDPLTIAGQPAYIQLPEKYKLPDKKTTEFYFLELLKQGDKCIKKMAGMEGDGGLDKHDSWTQAMQGIADLNSFSRKLDNFTRNIIKESIKTFSKDRGNLPGHIAELIEQALAPPKAPYYQIIQKLVRATRISKFKRSHTKINRKRTYVFNMDDSLPAISPFPGRTRDFTFKVCVLIDTSGSMSIEDVKEGLSGVKNIIENDRHCDTTVLEVDAGVEKEYKVKKIKDIQFNIKGRGGTTLGPGIDRARQLGVDVCLAFTDGYTEPINEYPRKKFPKKMIWVITKGGNSKAVNKTGWVVAL